ncbi:MAG TPA: DUF494 family protein [Firmicutes bacterium]|jgi:hypothetical protein|nr:DUF494 family protein [Bacillota bacterium]HHT41966.1 DUF494 family protein [Bacillota bacterium]
MALSDKPTRRPFRMLNVISAEGLGLNSEFVELFHRLAEELELSMITLAGMRENKGRVFGLWEQTFLSQEARDFLMAALHRDVITAEELEQTLAALFAQEQGFADLEDVQDLLDSIVEDPERHALLTLYEGEYIQ